MMIDWVSAIIPCSHPKKLRGGQFLLVNADGEIEQRSDRYLPVEGSHSSKIVIKSLCREEGKEYYNKAYAAQYLRDPPAYFYFSGNPIKFLRGHNLYGPTNIIDLMNCALREIFYQLNLQPTAEQQWKIANGIYPITRLDLNEMTTMASRSEVLAWIRAAGHASRSRHKSGAILNGDTLYWGKSSRKWAMKVYAKGQEVTSKGHELPENLPCRDKLIEWAQNKRRWELVLKSNELKHIGLHTAARIAKADLVALFGHYKSKIILPDNIVLPNTVLAQLPRKLRATYALWLSGEDLRNTLSKNTYYRHRRMLLPYQIDIHVPPTERTTSCGHPFSTPVS